jgi:hypothetical protein
MPAANPTVWMRRYFFCDLLRVWEFFFGGNYTAEGIPKIENRRHFSKPDFQGILGNIISEKL